MADPIELAADVVVGATALAGLILVYLGSVASGYASYDRAQQATVRAAFQLRAWFAFAGMFLAIITAMLALLAKWLHNTCMASAAIVLLFLVLFWGVAIAFLSAREIR